MPTLLDTLRFVLREFTVCDADGLLRSDGDARVMTWCESLASRRMLVKIGMPPHGTGEHYGRPVRLCVTQRGACR